MPFLGFWDWRVRDSECLLLPRLPAKMAEFRKWRMDFEEAEKRSYPDPPGFDAASGREVVKFMPDDSVEASLSMLP